MNVFDVFVGSYGSAEEPTIHWLRFNVINQRFKQITSVSGVENPSFLTVNQKQNRLYVVSEVDEGEVVSFSIDWQREELIELNRQSTNGCGPCFLEVHSSDRYLFTTNYGSGSIVVHPLTVEGRIAKSSDWHDYSKKALEKGIVSHPHMIRNIPNTPNYLVTDLGMNVLNLYMFQEKTGNLSSCKQIKVSAGSGPRHLTFHPYFRRLYVVNELNSTVLVYAYDEEKMDLEWLQTIETIPTEYVGNNYCADIHVSSNGENVYVSNRGHDSIAAYQIQLNGTLKMLGHISCGGKWPRNFAVVPCGNQLLVANEHSNSINIMTIQDDGMLRQIDVSYSVTNPVCLQVIDGNSSFFYNY